MQPVSTSSTSSGAIRHAHSFVTSSQPDGSARPMGIRQLYIQDGCDWTAGSAVMVYSAAEIFPVALMAIDVGMLLIMDMGTDIDVIV